MAAADKIRQVLGWQPQHDSLDKIVSSSLAWEKKTEDIKLWQESGVRSKINSDLAPVHKNLMI